MYEKMDKLRMSQEFSVVPSLSRKKDFAFDKAKATELYLSGMNDREIAEVMHVSVGFVNRWRLNAKLKSQAKINAKSQEEITRSMFSSGATDDEIAKALGVGRHRVLALRTEYGLRRRSRGDQRRSGTSERPQR